MTMMYLKDKNGRKLGYLLDTADKYKFVKFTMMSQEEIDKQNKTPVKFYIWTMVKKEHFIKQMQKHGIWKDGIPDELSFQYVDESGDIKIDKSKIDPDNIPLPDELFV